MIKAIVFDFWNTLAPTTIDFVHLSKLARDEKLSLGDFITKYELATHMKKYKNFEELRNDFFAAFKQYDNELLEKELYEIYFNRFDKIYLFPEVEKVLAKLKAQGYRLALLTNTESLHAEEIRKILRLDDYFDVFAYSFDVHAVKPDPKAFEYALKLLKVKPSEAMMVGDSLRSDIEGSKVVGMHNAWINRKGRAKAFDLSGPKAEYELSSLEDLFKVLGHFKK
ncbi:MAG: HAD family hydrolase [archaeon]